MLDDCNFKRDVVVMKVARRQRARNGVGKRFFQDKTATRQTSPSNTCCVAVCCTLRITRRSSLTCSIRGSGPGCFVGLNLHLSGGKIYVFEDHCTWSPCRVCFKHSGQERCSREQTQKTNNRKTMRTSQKHEDMS